MAAAAGLASRYISGWNAPLWLDETYSATIAGQPDVTTLLHWCLTELSGPVYYSAIWAWEKLAGESNDALRLLSLLFSLAAPLSVLRTSVIAWPLRITWAALICCWLPGLLFAAEARPYALLFFVSTLQALQFLHAVDRPARSPLVLWAVCSTVAILTHYHAAFVVLFQGLALAWLYRRRLSDLFAAGLIFCPALAWMMFHIPYVLGYSASGTTWHAMLTSDMLSHLPTLLFGESIAAIPLLALLIVWLVGRTRPTKHQRIVNSDGVLLLTLMSIAAIATVLVIGLLTPSFSPRYLVATMPALLAGVSAALVALERRVRYSAVLAVVFIASLGVGASVERHRQASVDLRSKLNFEQASDWIMEGQAERLIFLWDNPTAGYGPSKNLEEVGGFFLRRAGRPIPVVALRPAISADANLAIAAMTRESEDAIIWMWDNDVIGTTARRYLPRLASTQTRACRTYDYSPFHVLACRPSR